MDAGGAAEQPASEQAPVEKVDRSQASAASFAEFKNNCRLYVTVMSQHCTDVPTTLGNFGTWIEWIKGGSGSPAHVQHFYEVALPAMTIAVLRYNFEVHELEYAARYLDQVVSTLAARLKMGAASDAEVTLCLDLFNPGSRLYEMYGRNEELQLNFSLLPLPRTSEASAGQSLDPSKQGTEEWLDELDVGSLVEVLVGEREEWAFCRVLQVSPTNTEMEVAALDCPLSLENLEDAQVLAAVSRVVDTFWVPKELRLARPIRVSAPTPRDPDASTPPKSPEQVNLERELAAVLQYDHLDEATIRLESWRGDLVGGHMCDARRPDGRWCQATVVDVDAAAEQAAHRETDSLRIHYRGFKSAEDEWIVRGSLRLAQLNSCSFGRRGRLGDQSGEHIYSLAVVPDGQDPSDVFAMPRSIVGIDASMYLVHNLSRFCLLEGVEALISRTTSASTPLLEGLNILVTFASRVSHLFSRHFAYAILPRVLSSAESIVDRLGQDEVRQLSKPLVAAMTDGLLRIAFRVESWHEAHSRIELLRLKFVSKRIASKAIKQRLDGMDALNDLVTVANNSTRYPAGLMTRQASAPSLSSSGESNLLSHANMAALESLVASQAARVSGEAVMYGPSPKPVIDMPSHALPVEPISPAAEPTEPDVSQAETVASTSFEWVRMPVAHYLSQERLADWILKSKIVQVSMLGSFAHQEMVRRCPELLRLLLSIGKLSPEFVDQFWTAMAAARGSDDELVEILYTVLAGLTSELQSSHIEAMMRGFEKLAATDYTEATLRLLAAVSCRSDKESTAARLEAINTLWACVQGGCEGFPPALLEAAHGQLREVVLYFSRADLTNPMRLVDGRTIREYLADKCLDNIRSSTDVLSSLRALKTVVRSFPPSHRSDESKEPLPSRLSGLESQQEVLHYLDERHQLLQICLVELVAFKTKSLVDGHQDNQRQAGLAGRFNWIMFVLHSSQLVLTNAHVDTLWDAFVDSRGQGNKDPGSSSAAADQLVFFNFVLQATVTGAGSEAREGEQSAFSLATLDYLFSDKFSKLAALAGKSQVHFSDAEFECFQTLFVAANKGGGNLVGVGETKPHNAKATSDSGSIVSELANLQVSKLPLLGDDLLWSLALDVESDSVAAGAARLLSKLQVLHSASLGDQVAHERLRFVDRVMNCIALASAELNDGLDAVAQVRRIRRALMLLQLLLSNTAETASQVCAVLGADAWQLLEPHSARARDQLFEVIVRNNLRGPGHGSKFEMQFFATDPVFRMRQSIAARLGVEHAGTLRLFAGGREIREESGSSLLRDLPGISAGTTILACEKPQSGREDGPECASEDSAENMVMAARKHTAELEQAHSRAHQLLNALPSVIVATNPAYFEQLFAVLDACASATQCKATNALAEEVWALLQALPSNQALCAGLDQLSAATLSALTWSEPSPLKVLYLLELLEARFSGAVSLAEPAGHGENGNVSLPEFEGHANHSPLPMQVAGSLSVKLAWLPRFMQAGGVAVLDQCYAATLRWTKSQERSAESFVSRKCVAALAILASLEFKTVWANLPVAKRELLHGAVPNMTKLAALQKEIDMSGACLTEPSSVFFAGTTPLLPSMAQGNAPERTSQPPSDEPEVELQELGGTPRAPNSLSEAEQSLGDLSRLASLDARSLAELSGRAFEVLADLALSPKGELTGAGADDEVAGKSTGDYLALVAWTCALWLACAEEFPTEQVTVLAQAGLCCQSGPIPFATRQIVHNLFRTACRANTSLSESVIAVLHSQVEPSSSSDIESSKEYFELAEELMGAVLAVRPDRAPEFVRALFMHLARREVVEADLHVVPSRVDSVMLQYLGQLEGAIANCSRDAIDQLIRPGAPGADQGDLARFVFAECLFGDSGVSQLRCYRPATRHNAFAVGLALMDKTASPALWDRLSEWLQGKLSVPARTLALHVLKRNDAKGTKDMWPVGKAASEVASKVEVAGWGVTAGTDQRAESGFAGLENLGCICYMNSLIQQLFMIPRIRYGILGARAAGATEEQNDDEGKTRSGSDYAELLTELQRMFAALDGTVEQAYKPSTWCLTYKDPNTGQPVNVMVQQDAHEFFNTLCDRLDETLKGSFQEKLVSRALGVTITDQLICLETQDGSSLRRENAPVTEYCLTQDFSGSSTNLEESLGNFVAGEVLNDYRWEERDGAKLRTLKRQCIAELNDVVFIHLKRFRMNWETFLAEKVNSRFEFPLELDMFPFTKEGLEWKESVASGASEEDGGTAKYGQKGRAYYEFELSGIVVHSGSSLNGGHYYSYIRADDGPQRGRWYEFNDRTVRPFNPAELAEATFGGGGGLETTAHGMSAPSYNRNAYMIVYKRKVPQQRDCDFLRAEPGASSATQTTVSEACDILASHGVLERRHRAAIYSEEVLQELEEDNEAFVGIADKFGFALESFVLRGLEQLVAKIESANSDILAAATRGRRNFLQHAAAYVVNTLARSGTPSKFVSAAQSLCFLFSRLPSVQSQVFLEMVTQSSQQEAALEGILVTHCAEQSRMAFAALGRCAIKRAMVEGAPEWEGGMVAFVNELCRSLRRGLVRRNVQSGARPFWLVMNAAASCSAAARRVMAEHEVVAHVVDVFLGADSTLSEDLHEGEHAHLPAGSLPPSAHVDGPWLFAFSCAASILTQMWPFSESQVAAGRRPAVLSEGKPPLAPGPVTIRALSTRRFYEDALKLVRHYLDNDSMVRSTEFLEPLGTILVHCSFEWPEFSQHALRVVMQGLALAAARSIPTHMQLLQRLLEVDDSNTALRVDEVLGSHRVRDEAGGQVGSASPNGHCESSPGSDAGSDVPKARSVDTAQMTLLDVVLRKDVERDLLVVFEFLRQAIKLVQDCDPLLERLFVSGLDPGWSSLVETVLVQAENHPHFASHGIEPETGLSPLESLKFKLSDLRELVDQSQEGMDFDTLGHGEELEGDSTDEEGETGGSEL